MTVIIKPQHCEKCGADYTPIINSDDCPHNKVVIAVVSELTPEEINIIVALYPYGVSATIAKQMAKAIAKAQLAHTLKRLWEALEQSREGKPLDLSEKEYVLFEAIGNNAVAKAYRDDEVCPGCWGQRFVDRRQDVCSTCKGSGKIPKARSPSKKDAIAPPMKKAGLVTDAHPKPQKDRPELRGRKAFLSLPIEERRRLLSEQVMLMDEQDREAIRDLHKLD